MSRRLDWKTLVAEHAQALNVEAILTGNGVGKYETVKVECSHGQREVMACRFIATKYCCRKQARKNQTGRELVGQKISEKLKGRKLPLERRLKHADGARSRAPAQPTRPDLFYVAVRGDKVKVGRCSLHRLRWLKERDLIVVEGWELESWAAFSLEQQVHKRFGHLRSLDPAFGTGWTEVFDVPPQKLITFIKYELSKPPCDLP